MKSEKLKVIGPQSANILKISRVGSAVAPTNLSAIQRHINLL